jgi:hypothetical protein
MKKSIVLILVCIQAMILSVIVSSASGQNINLQKDWNFISFQKLPSDGALIETVLADVLPKVTIVWGYDNTSKQWKKWKPQGGAGNTLTTFEFGKGYWIYMDNTGSIPATGWTASPSLSFPLYAGWNLVGHMGTDDRSVTDTLQSLGWKWNILWNWTGGQWYVKHPTVATLPVQSLAALNRGKAYWIKVTQSVTWTWRDERQDVTATGNSLASALTAQNADAAASLFTPEVRETYRAAIAAHPDVFATLATSLSEARITVISQGSIGVINRRPSAEISIVIDGITFPVVLEKVNGAWLFKTF